MKRIVMAWLFVSACILLLGTGVGAETRIQLAEFTFVSQRALPAEKHAELLLAFRHAIHDCVEYEWAKHNIRPVEVSVAEGVPPSLKVPAQVALRQLGSLKFAPRTEVPAAKMARYYRFVIRFKPNPTWEDGKPIKNVTEAHSGVAYVTLDAAGAVNGVFYYYYTPECTWCDFTENKADELGPNITPAICS